MEKYGFLKVGEWELADISAHATEYRHVRSGARLLHLDRADENKTFMIAFKTPPTDSTGVFHIIEHSVLCGSEKYPLRDPFVELLKSSLNTFLNAMTYPDKTVYPVSSMNDKDFLNLVSVYMDAVFNPAFLKNELIFMQEGHRLTCEGGVPAENGVVLNEMLGAYSSAEEIESEKIMELLYPDTPYAYSSGGDPDEIPKLTYEKFVDAYRRHYAPSGAYMVLDGAVKLDEVLPLLDGYLCHYEYVASDIEIPPAPKPHGERRELPYSTSEGESLTDKTRITVGMRTFDFSEREKNLALAVVRDAIASSVTSPLIREMLDTGLCEDINVSPIDELRDAAMTISLINVKDGRGEELVALLVERLRRFAREGFDASALDAALTSIEFYTREKNYGRLPAGVLHALTAMESWLYSDNCTQNLSYSDVFASLREKIGTDYYKNILAEILPEDDELIVLTLTPDAGLESRIAEARVARAASAWEELGEVGQRKQSELCRRFDEWQATPDTPESKSCLPKLSVADINPVPEWTSGSSRKILCREVSSFDIKTSGIIYVAALFDVADLTPEECSELALLCAALGHVETEGFDEGELGVYIKSKLGYINATPITPPHESGEVKNYVKISIGLLPSGLSELAEIFREVLTRSRFNKRNISKLLSRTAIAMRENMCSDGTGVAIDRTYAGVSAVGALNDYYYGYEAYRRVLEYAADEGGAERLAQRLTRLAERIFVRERVSLFTAGEIDDTTISSLISVLPAGAPITEPYPYAPLDIGHEGIELPVSTAFTALGFDMPDGDYTAAYKTVKTILKYEYLWAEIRAKGGAYGAGHTHRRGFAAFSSYRDPNPARSLDKYAEAADFLDSFADSVGEGELEKYVIGAFAEIDGVSSARLSFDLATVRHLRGIGYEKVAYQRKETLETARDDIRRYAELLRRELAHAVSCTVASHDILEGMGERIERINKIV